MYTASLDLCKELYELSGWGKAETHFTYYDGELGETEPWDKDADNRKAIPAYDLGYLLRRLDGLHIELHRPFLEDEVINRWCAYYFWPCTHLEVHRFNCVESAETPEDAACMLAIELFKHGILKKEEWAT